MNQLHLSIGVPRGGSAARIAEEAAKRNPHFIRTQAGSAARDAEECKRSEGAVQHSAIRLRAHGARVAAIEHLHPEQAANRSSEEASHKTQRVSVERVDRGATSDPTAGATFVTSTAFPGKVVEESVSSRPLQTAAVRIKSLVQSLLSLGVSSSKS